MKEQLINKFLDLYERQTVAIEKIVNSFSSPNPHFVELSLEDINIRKKLLTNLSDTGFSVRAYKCLEAINVTCIADIVQLSRHELMRCRNFGKKSLNEIAAYIEANNLHFGMDVTRYGIIPNRKPINNI